jgi:hypothetical protein
MNFSEFFKRYDGWTEFSLELEETQLRLFRAIGNNLANKKIQRVVDWDGPRTTDTFDDDGYCDLCRSILDFYAPGFDCGSSRYMHEMYQFVSECCLYHAGKNAEVQVRLKEEKIKKLQAELDGLRKSK